jgi:hypothetical protein
MKKRGNMEVHWFNLKNLNDLMHGADQIQMCLSRSSSGPGWIRSALKLVMNGPTH